MHTLRRHQKTPRCIRPFGKVSTKETSAPHVLPAGKSLSCNHKPVLRSDMQLAQVGTTVQA